METIVTADQLRRYRVERAKWNAHAQRGLGREAILPNGVTFETFAHGRPSLAGIPEFLEGVILFAVDHHQGGHADGQQQDDRGEEDGGHVGGPACFT